MTAPELIHTDSSSTTFLGGDEMRNDDLPSGHGGADLEATTQTGVTGVADVVDSDTGALGRPGLVSDDKGSGAIAPSAMLESDRDGSSPATEFDIPKLGAIRADIDGSLLTGKDGYESIPNFTPRGSFNPPTTVLQKDTKKDSKKESKKDTKKDTEKDTKKDTEDTKKDSKKESKKDTKKDTEKDTKKDTEDNKKSGGKK